MPFSISIKMDNLYTRIEDGIAGKYDMERLKKSRKNKNSAADIRAHCLVLIIQFKINFCDIIGARGGT